jgi:ABC-2 type transport system ATP-binding protein
MSTGNKQRLAVARAMLSKPPVLLLDEPTRSLDPLAAARMRDLIRSLAQQEPPVTILLTSHNLDEVETLCGRVAIISRGRIRAIDTPQQLRSLTSGTERVHIIVAGLNGANEPTKVSFTRQATDYQLDEMLRDLQQRGGRILDINVERATLLDVLELYESGTTDEHEEHG